MPVHDWSRVFDGAFHDFHTAWNIEIRNALNGRVLPAGYYAMVEQVAKRAIADVLTLQSKDGPKDLEPIGGAITVTTAPPRVQQRDRIEAESFTRRQKSIVIRHSSDDRVIALIEIISAGNKSSNKEFRAFINKALRFIDLGYHLLLIDLQPRTKRDPGGIHSVIWTKLGGKTRSIPADKPLTLASYDAGPPPTAYVEPIAVGDTLIDMPLFLAPDWYVSVPLEETYQAAFRGTPRPFRETLEAT